MQKPRIDSTKKEENIAKHSLDKYDIEIFLQNSNDQINRGMID